MGGSAMDTLSKTKIGLDYIHNMGPYGDIVFFVGGLSLGLAAYKIRNTRIAKLIPSKRTLLVIAAATITTRYGHYGRIHRAFF